MPKWIVSPPGGPDGPFYGVVSQTGEVIVLRAGSKARAELIAKLGAILDYDFRTINEAGLNLRRILVRDGAHGAVDLGADDYVVKSVIEALFGEDSLIQNPKAGGQNDRR